MIKSFIDLDACIKKILFQDWDPIGINKLLGAEDEYDGYVPNLRKLLLSGASDCEICEYLRWIEVEYMGLDGNEDSRREVAGKIGRLKLSYGKP